MKTVFIKYNPYKLETEITVDKKKLAQNSILREKSDSGSRLQEWVEELPRILVDEYNDTDFEIEFHGTLLDYEDLTSVITDAQNRGEITEAKCEHKPAKETSDKEALIDNVFAEIQQGPFDELRHPQIISAFQHAKSEDFEVCVVATMSAGKSTLINALLGSKLMPSKQEACTAIVTRIKDNDNIPFRAEVYDKNNKLMVRHENVTLPIMESLNSDENVSEIKLYGNIPFVSSEDVSLVLIDTPGPNNARDDRHRKVQNELLGKSSKTLVLYIMTGEFGTDDDNALLKRVADSMAVGGKQSKDRFIFVVNKLEDRKKEDGDINQTLDRVRSYLKSHGVINPNLFLAGALTALGIRMIKSGVDIDVDTIDDTKNRVRKLNRNNNDQFHFEDYATLPLSIHSKIKKDLNEACLAYNDQQYENIDEALIHTGVVSIEAAIRQYVQKYSKTVKIKNIVETFIHQLEDLDCFEKTKQELAKHQEESAKIVKKIDSIREKIDSTKEAEKFKDAVNVAVTKVNDESKEVVNGIIQKFQSSITEMIDSFCKKVIDINEVEHELGQLEKFANELMPDFEVGLNELIKANLENTGNALLKGYKNKLASLVEEIDAKDLTSLTIDPLKLMSGSLNYDNFSTKELVKTKKVEDGVEEVETRGWFESIFFWPKKELFTKYKEAKYIEGSELAREFLSPVEKNLSDNGDAACKYAIEQSKRISDDFNVKFKQLDDILKSKLDEFESYATDQKKAEQRIKESECKLEWLEQIKAKVESILEI
jgi:predicted GTPase